MKKVRYAAPEVEVLDVLVEAGFAASGNIENPEEGEED